MLEAGRAEKPRLYQDWSTHYNMTLTPQPYPAYKPSNVDWLGDVPAHWEVRRLRNILTGTNERNRPDLPLLSVVRERGVILRDVSNMEENHNFIPDDLSNYKVVKGGQFAMNKMKAWQGSYGVSQHDGIVSPAYFVFQVQGVSGDYLHRAIRSKAYVPYFAQASDGVRIGQWDLSQARMREIPFPLPPLPEQRAIVRYLDHVDERIRRYVSAKDKLIALLEEERQAVIHLAVTRGLDPNVPLKPSGVEWLGDVPEHWEVGPLKRFAARRSGAIKAGPFGSQLTAAEMTEADFKVYTQRNVIDRDLEKGSNYISRAKFHSLRAFEVVSGDVLVTSRGTIGRTALVSEGCERGVLHPCLLRVQPDLGHLVPEFLMTLIQDSQLLPQQLTFLSNATTIEVIYSSTLSNIDVPRPPLHEQTAIVEHLDKATAGIDAAISRAHRQIELLREYRTRLIADVVTGKLDVREAAAQLPEGAGDRDWGEDEAVGALSRDGA